MDITGKERVGWGGLVNLDTCAVDEDAGYKGTWEASSKCGKNHKNLYTSFIC